KPPAAQGQDSRPAAQNEAKAEGEPQPAGTDRYGDPLPEAALARLGTLRFRQGSSVHITQFSRDGKIILLGGGGRSLGLWDTGTGREIRQFPLRGTACDAAL